MACSFTRFPGGGGVVSCGRGQQRRCHYCSRPSSKLCDFKVPGGTCDRRLCGQCAVSTGPDADECRFHSMAAK